MAIGGYKFRGYHYPARTAPAGSDAEKAIFLDWFKCRLAAFKASCEASGALWRLLPACADSGTYSGTAWSDEDACIHELDDTGCNFGTFFQYGTEEKYMAMVSLNSGTQTAGIWSYKESSSSSRKDTGNDYISLGDTEITPDNVFTATPGRMKLRSVSGNTTMNPVDHGRNVSSCSYGVCFGFATKDADIEEFFTAGSVSSLATAGMYWRVASLTGFASLCAPSDTYHAVSMVGPGREYSSSIISIIESRLQYPVQYLKSTGDDFFGYSDQSTVPGDLTSVYISTMSAVPFVAPSVVTSIQSITSGAIPNTDGLCAKGLLRADLAAINCDVTHAQYSSTIAYQAYGGGNYLCVSTLSVSSSSGNRAFQGAFYIGWDPSNPSILASTSWPDWPDAMPEA